METKRIWIICIIALLVSGTAVAIVAMGFNHYKKLSMATDIEKELSSSEPSLIELNESQDQKEPVFGPLPKEEAEKAEHEAEFNEWLEIAKKDEQVQELIAGKEYMR